MLTRFARVRHDDDHGFSLVEVIVSIGLFAIILTSAGAAIISAITTQRTMEERDRGTQLGQEYAAKIAQVGWDQIGFYDTEIANAASNGTPAYYTSAATYTPPDLTAENRVSLGASGTSPVLTPAATQTVNGRPYTVITHVTWATPEGTVTPAQTGDNSYKRITIETRWDVPDGTGNCPGDDTQKCTYQSVLRAPSSSDKVPPKVGGTAATVDPCPVTTQPYCKVHVTAGNVLAENSDLTGAIPLASPVQFYLETRTPVNPATVSATIDYSGFTVTIPAYTPSTTYGFKATTSANTAFLATLPAEIADDVATTPTGWIRPGSWTVAFTVNSGSGDVVYNHPVTWGYHEATAVNVVAADPLITPANTLSNNGTAMCLNPNATAPNGYTAGFSITGQSPTDVYNTNYATRDKVTVSARPYRSLVQYLPPENTPPNRGHIHPWAYADRFLDNTTTEGGRFDYTAWSSGGGTWANSSGTWVNTRAASSSTARIGLGGTALAVGEQQTYAVNALVVASTTGYTIDAGGVSAPTAAGANFFGTGSVQQFRRSNVPTGTAAWVTGKVIIPAGHTAFRPFLAINGAPAGTVTITQINIVRIGKTTGANDATQSPGAPHDGLLDANVTSKDHWGSFWQTGGTSTVTFDAATFPTGDPAGTNPATDAVEPQGSLKVVTPTNGTVSLDTAVVKVTPGQTWNISATVKSGGQAPAIKISGAPTEGGAQYFGTGAVTVKDYYQSSAAGNNTWTVVSTSFTVPAGINYIRPYFHFDATSGVGGTGGTSWLSSVSLTAPGTFTPTTTPAPNYGATSTVYVPDRSYDSAGDPSVLTLTRTALTPSSDRRSSTGRYTVTIPDRILTDAAAGNDDVFLLKVNVTRAIDGNKATAVVQVPLQVRSSC
jgi:prepilin-type N-terminal cleavage/methylation domain-containing protein